RGARREARSASEGSAYTLARASGSPGRSGKSETPRRRFGLPRTVGVAASASEGDSRTLAGAAGFPSHLPSAFPRGTFTRKREGPTDTLAGAWGFLPFGFPRQLPIPPHEPREWAERWVAGVERSEPPVTPAAGCRPVTRSSSQGMRPLKTGLRDS